MSTARYDSVGVDKVIKAIESLPNNHPYRQHLAYLQERQTFFLSRLENDVRREKKVDETVLDLLGKAYTFVKAGDKFDAKSAKHARAAYGKMLMQYEKPIDKPAPMGFRNTTAWVEASNAWKAQSQLNVGICEQIRSFETRGMSTKTAQDETNAVIERKQQLLASLPELATMAMKITKPSDSLGEIDFDKKANTPEEVATKPIKPPSAQTKPMSWSQWLWGFFSKS